MSKKTGYNITSALPVVIKDLGTMNGWNETPIEFKVCKEAGHELTVENLGRCYNKYTCEICKISWKVDSGD